MGTLEKSAPITSTADWILRQAELSVNPFVLSLMAIFRCIRVTNGSGYVLDVCYHNGYSTINRHLSGFVSPIAERVEKLQYEEESWEVEIVPGTGKNIR